MYENKWYTGGIRKIMLDWIAVAGIAVCLIGGYVNNESYQTMIGYMPVIAISVLAILFYNHVNWIKALKTKDWAFYLVIAGVLIELCNIKLSHSGYGVILNITSFFLILYLADKVKINPICYYAISAISMVCLLNWIGKEENQYNTNMAAMILLILAAGSMSGVGIWLNKIKHENLYRWYMLLLTALVAAGSWNLRARGILIGIGVFWILSLLIPRFVWKWKWLYRFAVILLLAIGIAFPITYVTVWENGTIQDFDWLGKHLYTGRQKIWIQYFTAFQKEPWTGIGSDIHSKIENVYFTEVHNAFLHILFIHGIIIFILIMILWASVFWKAQKYALKSAISRQNIYMAVALMVSSISENYIVLPAYSLIFFLLLANFFVEPVTEISGGKEVENENS